METPSNMMCVVLGSTHDGKTVRLMQLFSECYEDNKVFISGETDIHELSTLAQNCGVDVRFDKVIVMRDWEGILKYLTTTKMKHIFLDYPCLSIENLTTLKMLCECSRLNITVSAQKSANSKTGIQLINI